MPEKVTVRLQVNGTEHAVETWPMVRLLDVLRHDLALTGTKEGCGEGECGACAVIFNGHLVNSCLIPALESQGASIQTIEGLASEDRLHRLQQSFIESGGAQCGICTPGMILAAASLLRRYPHPNPEQIREALSGNLCRCTGYMRIFESVAAAAGDRP